MKTKLKQVRAKNGKTKYLSNNSLLFFIKMNLNDPGKELTSFHEI